MSEQLYKMACEARENAVATYSHFRVGAALRAASGRVYTGCNVENASYGLTICAERVAIFKALSEGERRFTEICIVADTERLTPPCGPCRQIIWEFCGDIPVIMNNLQGTTKTFSMRELLPEPFDGGLLDENRGN